MLNASFVLDFVVKYFTFSSITEQKIVNVDMELIERIMYLEPAEISLQIWFLY